jgi:membrane fusion protein, multidrug efflux system
MRNSTGVYAVLVAIFQNVFGLALAVLLERDTRLHQAGAVSERDLERSRTRVATAEAALADAQARLVSAKEQLDKTTVRAPFPGIVSEREISAGDVVQAGALLYAVVDPSSMQLEATVPADQLQSLKIGTPVEFTVSGYGARRFQGRIARINPSVDPATRQVRIYVTIPNRDQGLVAGLFAEGRVESRSRRRRSPTPSPQGGRKAEGGGHSVRTTIEPPAPSTLARAAEDAA